MARKGSPKAKRTVVIIAIALIVLIIAALMAIPYMVMPMFLGQRYEQMQYDSLDFGVPAEQVTLTTEDDLSLAAWRIRADNTKGSVVILSGIQNPSVTAFFGYGKMLADHGWDSLLIEMRARSQSEGDEHFVCYDQYFDDPSQDAAFSQTILDFLNVNFP